MKHTSPLMRLVAGAVLTLTLLACGGSGGGGGDTINPAPTPEQPDFGGGTESPVPSGGYRLSGSISLADVLAVDVDTNDANQGGSSRNDSLETAQPLSSPITVVGSVNAARSGPAAGRHYSDGDPLDLYRLELAQGQVVEMFVGVDGDRVDADLCVFSEDRSTAGCSVSVTAHECVRAAGAGTYYVAASAYRDAAVYQIRVSAPGLGAPCENVTAPYDGSAPDFIVALPNDGAQALSTGQRSSKVQALTASGLSLKRHTHAQYDLIRVPDAPLARARAVTALERQRARAPGRDQQPQGLLLRSSADRLQEPSQAWRTPLMRDLIIKELRLTGLYRSVQAAPRVRALGHLVGTYPPSDSAYASQRWHYEQIALPQAMRTITAMSPQPGQRPIAAIIDSGVMLDHPDLEPQLASTGRRFASRERLGDLDSASGDTVATRFSELGEFHGTHVAGTVAASSFDSGRLSFGAGVAPMALLMPLNVFDGDSTYAFDYAEAMLYAAGLPNRSGTLPARRADVINLSLGGPTTCSELERQVIAQVRAAGVIVVAAAGNDGGGVVGSPANCPGVIAVSATDAQRELAPYSTYGTALDVAAPGGDATQSLNGSGSVDAIFSTVGSFDAEGTRLPAFTAMQGTSMASPHVAGVMALMRYVNPSITPAQVDDWLQQGLLTEDLGANGKDTRFGWGLISARRAVDTAQASLAGGGATPSETSEVLAVPSALDFGARETRLELSLEAAGTRTDERVTSIRSDSAAVSVTSQSVDARTGLGVYSVSVDRSKLPSAGSSHFPTLSVALSSGRTIEVQLSITRGSSDQVSVGDVGAVYVLLRDPDAQKFREIVQARYANGKYTWSASAYAYPRVQVIAGTDLDADDVICTAGEVCGAFPSLGSWASMTLELARDRSNLDFAISPMGPSASLSLQRVQEPPFYASKR